MDVTQREKFVRAPAQTGQMIRVAVIDDHPLLCEGIRRALNLYDDIQVVGEAHTAAEAVEILVRLEPDVALLDYRLPDEDGISVLREIQARGLRTQAIVLTCHTGDHHVRTAIDNGAVGFLSKASANTDTLVGAIRDAGSGISAVSPEALSSLMRAVRHDDCDHVSELTDRERQVWGLVSSGMTNREIATRLCLSERTVKFHVGNVFRKLQVRSRSEATALAYRCGFMDQ